MDPEPLQWESDRSPRGIGLPSSLLCHTHLLYLYFYIMTYSYIFMFWIVSFSRQWSPRLSREEHPGEQSCHQTDGDPTLQHGGALFLFAGSVSGSSDDLSSVLPFL